MRLRTNCCTIGIRVPPPTRTTSSISAGRRLASFSALLTGLRSLAIKSSHNSSNWLRLRRVSRCFGPSSVAVINGRLMSVMLTLDSSILAFSAASERRCKAWRSRLKSTSSASKNISASQSTIFWSKSLPPSCVSPLVALTSNTPSPTSKIETSKVPPPKSNTKIV